MIKSVNNYPISQLFDIEAGVVYAIPRYQREYTWNTTQWESLFDDILENDPGYFIGSIICINQSTDALTVQKLEVVDGQQRLTTLSLLFAAVYEVLKKHEEQLDDDQRLELLNLKRKLVLKKGDDQLRIIPQIQNQNNADYLAVLSEINVIGKHEYPRYCSARKIYRAFQYFKHRLQQMEADGLTRIELVSRFLDKVNRASLVKIEVVSHADAYILFESLNNRGIPLSAIDLIKNKLLARLEQIEPGRVDAYFNKWMRLLDYLGNDYATQERFFRQYYNAFKNDLKAIHQVPVATRSNLIQIYEKLINDDAKEFLQSINDAARVYSVILSLNQDHPLNGLEMPLKNLERIQGAPSYVLVMYLLLKRNELELTDKHLVTIVNLLVRFFVRRNLTDTPPTRDLTRFFMLLIDNICFLKGESIPRYIESEIIGISASDEAFRTKLEGPIYEENSWVARFILCSLAEQHMTRETQVDLWSLDKKQYVWTIEHIFPQGQNIPDSWVDMIASGDSSLAKERQQLHVHKLGNLTISGYNSVLGNKSFVEKRDRKDRQGRAVGYNNGLKLNEDLERESTWDIDKIEQRTQKLVNQALQLFTLTTSDS
jgi:hypothetical protein